MEKILRENQIEQEKTEKKRVVFFFGCHTTEELKQRMAAIAKEEKMDLVMLNEYDFQIDEVNNNVATIASLAQENATDILIAAGSNGHTVPWETQRQELIQTGAQPLDVDAAQDDIWDSIGYFFEKSGKTYAFPKNHKDPIHLIPKTKTAVSICGEIARITPEILEKLDINLILNPAREADDPHLHFRMMGFFNPNISDDEIHFELRKDPYLNDLAEGKSAPPDYSQLDEESRILLEEYDKTHPIPSAEELKHEYKKLFDEIKSITKDQSTRPSAYIENIDSTLASKKITVLRCDGKATTGILNPSLNVKIDQLDYQNNYYKMSFTQKI